MWLLWGEPHWLHINHMAFTSENCVIRNPGQIIGLTLHCVPGTMWVCVWGAGSNPVLRDGCTKYRETGLASGLLLNHMIYWRSCLQWKTQCFPVNHMIEMKALFVLAWIKAVDLLFFFLLVRLMDKDRSFIRSEGRCCMWIFNKITSQKAF